MDLQASGNQRLHVWLPKMLKIAICWEQASSSLVKRRNYRMRIFSSPQLYTATQPIAEIARIQEIAENQKTGTVDISVSHSRESYKRHHSTNRAFSGFPIF